MHIIVESKQNIGFIGGINITAVPKSLTQPSEIKVRLCGYSYIYNSRYNCCAKLMPFI